MLFVENLCCQYEEEIVLKNISFSLSEQEILCVIGVNGSGKSTLLKTLAHLIPHQGTIQLNQQPLHTYSSKQLAQKLSVFTQTHTTSYGYTVWETVAFGRYPHMKHGFSSLSQTDEEMVNQALQQTGLLPLKDTEVSHLSGGQLQRVHLARIFAQNPSIILLDEPTNHLDLKYQLDILSYLKEWVLQPKKAIIGVFHDLNIVQHFANTILLLHDKTILSYGKKETVLTTEHLSKAYDMDVFSYMKESYKKWSDLV